MHDQTAANAAVGIMMLLPLLLFCAFGTIALVATIFWLWALVDCATKEPSEGNDKITWILVIVFLHAIGALVYVLARRPDRIRLHGR